MPRLLKHYETKNDLLYHSIKSQVTAFTHHLGLAPKLDIVLFGGLLGSMYSFLQFISAPWIGSLSDKYGRRPVLLVSMLGNALSMILWIFGDSFVLFVWSRIIGGLTEGNVQMSIAMISDISTEETRSRSLALVVGAYFTSIDLKTILPDWPVNQYSTPALFALVLITIETVYMYFYLPETLVKKDEKKNKEQSTKSIFNLSVIHFLFLFVYSGMEFTLTFLTFDRFNFSNKQQGRLLGFIGIFTALVQGGYVRRIRNTGMEKNVVFNGVVACAIGLFIIGCYY
ncbi:hypothetical protein HDV04_001753 [Boothiomyces sp. JEL0838]|nr:hypothetical protein HDV04_001753 [Boothiomyces sp. JEL0838]